MKCHSCYDLIALPSNGAIIKILIHHVFSSLSFDKLTDMPVTTYSGGWKVKMQLVAATLINADILMLDEPTGHLDVTNIEWLKNWLRSFLAGGGSIICTSHDSLFLEEMCTHIIDFQKKKLVMFKGNLKEFVDQYPEKKVRKRERNNYERRGSATSLLMPQDGA